MLRHGARWLLILALSASVGVHWGFLQTAAWVGMVATYAQEVPLGQALARTFDGKHPCTICKLVSNGKKSEKQRVWIKAMTHGDFLWQSRDFQIHSPEVEPLVTSMGSQPAVTFFDPPTPPPREA